MNITCHEKLVAFAVSRQSLPHGNKDAEYSTFTLRESQSKASIPILCLLCARLCSRYRDTAVNNTGPPSTTNLPSATMNKYMTQNLRRPEVR